MNTNKEEILKNLVVKLYAELKSGDAVARKLDMSRKTVYRLLHAAGVALPNRHDPKLYDRRKSLQGDIGEEAVQDYINGMSLPEMRKKYGVGNASIYTAIKDAGVPKRPHGGQARRFQGEEGKEMARLYVEDKLSQAQIAAKFGCAQPVVGRVLQEQGVQIRRDKIGRGEGHGNWGGGKTMTEGGYVYVRVSDDDLLASMRARIGYVLEHRYVMAQYLGRPLTDNESVHHINGVRTDNRIENLQLRLGKHGKGQVYKCADCGSYHIIEVEIEE